MFYPGLDSWSYPGHWEMDILRRYTNLRWTGYYLNRPGSNWNASVRARLEARGWGMLPIYCGQQANALSSSKGEEDGKTAAKLAQDQGFCSNSIIYIDFELWSSRMLPYFVGWAKALAEGGYLPGAYCEAPGVQDMSRAVPDARFFLAVQTGTGKVFESDPGSGVYQFVRYRAKLRTPDLTPWLDVKAPSATLGQNVAAVQYWKRAKLTFPIDPSDLSPSRKPHNMNRFGQYVVITIGDLRDDQIDVNIGRCLDPSLDHCYTAAGYMPPCP